MLKKKERKPVSQNKFLIIIIFFVFVIGIYGILFGSKDNKNESSIIINKSDINNKIINSFSNLKDNYSMKVTINENDKEYLYNYSIGDDVEILNGNVFKDDGYIIYNNKIYTNKNNKLVETDSIKYENFNVNYINLDFLKEISKNCEFEFVSTKKYTCNISIQKILNSYNKVYNTDYFVENDYDIDVNYVIFSKYLKSIKISFVKIDNIINNTDYDKLEYFIVYSDINSNDFKEYSDYIYNNN